MIELRHLRYLLAVADAAHITRAAERLGMAQPPLSQQIRQLEHLVGTPLFRRLPRGVAPTVAGQAFIDRARLILRDLDNAVETARRTARGEEGRLAMGFTSSAAFHPLVTSVVRSLRQASPGVMLTLEEGSTADLIEALRAERLDAALVRSPVESVEGLVIEPVLQEEMLLAVPDQHRLAARTARAAAVRVALSALADETFILYRRPSGRGLYDAIVAACRLAGFSARVEQEVPRLVSTLSLVAAGLGVSIIPASMARLETQGIAYRRLESTPALRAPLFLAYREEERAGALERLINTVRRQRDAG